ncbi:hypothetical protein NQT62_05840 [Limnobacter humi]|uniref:DUF3188 domain-containing protein n=1 Tax=Limnobacter humi TaxID=1778671 RepID=A0ABT1WEL5_9BURK|nr:hypothetical protein [Limnobacter humi]MCQ8895960.1 hypothetical protein [Limnobacter humi]
MKSLTSYPGVLTLIIVGAGLLVNGLVDYINYEVASPSVLGAIGCALAALSLVAVYEVRDLRKRRKSLSAPKA